MGTIYRRGRMYYVNFMYRGRRVRRKVGPSKDLADLVLKDMEIKICREQFDLVPPDALLEDLFAAFTSFSELNHAPTTALRYRQVIETFKIFLGIEYPHLTRVSQVGPELIEEFKRFRRTVDPREITGPGRGKVSAINYRRPGRGVTVNHEVGTLRRMFNFGRTRRMCGKNPCDGVPALKESDSPAPRFLTVAESEALVAHASDWFRPILITFLHTGLRKGELLNLWWTDIDLDRRLLRVGRKPGWTPKTREREVPLNQTMVDLLTTLRLARSGSSNRTPASPYVFPGPDGGILKRKLRGELIRTAERAGVPDMTRIHGLRHTFASHLVMAGVDLPTVQRLLGHADIQTTMVYAHLTADHVAKAVEKLNYSPACVTR